MLYACTAIKICLDKKINITQTLRKVRGVIKTKINILFSILLVMPTTSYSTYDAQNSEEAIGMMLMNIRKIQLYQFMCERYHGDLTIEYLNAIQTWESKNPEVLSNYFVRVNNVNVKELEEISRIDEQVNAKRISEFNQLPYEKQRLLCKDNIDDLMLNRELKKTPMMFKYLSE